MCRIRAFEEAANRASQGGVAAFGQSLGGSASVRGPLHLSIGQEAVSAGVCAHLTSDDYLTSTHRGHGHTLAKGADPTRMMLELYGKAGGYCGGRGGSMHIADFSVGMLGANGVVAAGMPIAVGAAHALKIQGRDAIAVSFFGDGAINRGPFGESLNWASAYGLPVLFVCEDNQWSATTRTADMSAGDGAAARARAYGIEAETVDGMDLLAVYQTAGRLIDAMRGDGRPRLLHALTYRFTGHVSVDPAVYRSPAEVAAARERDPIALAKARFTSEGMAVAHLDALAAQADAEIAAAVSAAEQAPWPDESATRQDVQDLASNDWT
ncbi:MAG: thiamine pyrophosphate-dependent dehydrogenase E1 component subunit alpha [Burkholderiaceae bacterium]